MQNINSTVRASLVAVGTLALVLGLSACNKQDDGRTVGQKLDAAVAKTAFVEAQSELMRAVSKGVVHKNTGSRKVSRLAAQLKKLATA